MDLLLVYIADPRVTHGSPMGLAWVYSADLWVTHDHGLPMGLRWWPVIHLRVARGRIVVTPWSHYRRPMDNP